MPRSQDKPFAIPRRMVWEAYRRVAANKGAPGVDGESLERFEADLENNLYKIWNVCHECGERVIGRRSRDRGSALRKMGDLWPSGIVLWGTVPNRRMLRWLKTVVVSDVEKVQVMHQVGSEETTVVDMSRS